MVGESCWCLAIDSHVVIHTLAFRMEMEGLVKRQGDAYEDYLALRIYNSVYL